MKGKIIIVIIVTLIIAICAIFLVKGKNDSTVDLDTQLKDLSVAIVDKGELPTKDNEYYLDELFEFTYKMQVISGTDHIYDLNVNEVGIDGLTDSYTIEKQYHYNIFGRLTRNFYCTSFHVVSTSDIGSVVEEKFSELCTRTRDGSYVKLRFLLCNTATFTKFFDSVKAIYDEYGEGTYSLDLSDYFSVEDLATGELFNAKIVANINFVNK